MKIRVISLFAAMLLFYAPALRADEGMWMINAISEALEKKMQERGLELGADEIYDAGAPGAALYDAVVSLDFGCTGSMISGEGLLITNHHCAYSDVHSLCTPEHNYLEDGFWAMKSSEERNIPGKRAWFLKKVIDVTREAGALLAEADSSGEHLGFRKLSWQLEKKYSRATGYEASLASMWGGSAYYISLYEVYEDVRLVAAPPVSIAAFGGDTDNWEWPQHKCDFALYRIYTAPDGSPAGYSPENVPLRPDAVLEISLDGYAPGDFAMVIGYPGSTDRYSSSYETDFYERVSLPVSNRLRGGQMDIIGRWMDSDSDIRLKYADYYFSLSNVQELNSGEVACCRRFGVTEEKEEQEAGMPQELLSALEKSYSASEDIRRNIVAYRETLVRGTRLARVNYRLELLKNEVLKSRGITPRRQADSLPPSAAETECLQSFRFRGAGYEAVCRLLDDYAGIDLRVEKDLFSYAVREYYAGVDSTLQGPYQRMLIRSLGDGGTVAEALWESSFLTDTARLHEFVHGQHTVNEYLSDPFYRFMQDVKIASFNRISAGLQGSPGIAALEREYVRILYAMRKNDGLLQYPDANSTMRITYGSVGGLEPRDGVICSWRTTVAGLLEKHNPEDYDFTLGVRQKELLERTDPDMTVDFLTDNDITGGNSGSPVLNSRGQLIGLAFDGNKESLAGNFSYTPGYNKCVCADIRFVLWTIGCYAGMNRIMDELSLDISRLFDKFAVCETNVK